ncbi:flagellar protein FlaG [Desulfohalobiaceae bacterium Ax17]|jgi:uncharacterized FlaG/YvyC family protein|uniref:flagellar protein FlaG n=1 Tax=Desulfovulcanus ferrireducens TaxID=2831190 RepID=UPI00207BC75F|nr:flagellar protein FlaG [Desulfovulcanus ferrireducens]MBT8764204.1 flagellar protein FlaG [Desulfovulcanus ferrireducens]
MKVQDTLNLNNQDTSNYLPDQKKVDSHGQNIEKNINKEKTDKLPKNEFEKIENLARSIENYLNSLGVKLKFHIHKETNKLQVDVVDPETNKIIRKIPPDELLNLAASIEKMVGIFINRSL